MNSQQLLGYIEKCRSQGLTDSLIEKALLDAGWSQSDVKAGLSGGSASSAVNELLPSGRVLLAETWIMLKQKPKQLILTLLPAAVVALLTSVSHSDFSRLLSGGNSYYNYYFPLSALGFFLFLVSSLWDYVAFLQIIKDWSENIDVVTAYRRSAGRVLAVFWVALLVSLTTMLGYFCFILPGVWAAIALSFSMIICFFENAEGFGALRQSYRLVSGHWWSVFWYFAVVSLVLFLLSAVVMIVLAIMTFLLSLFSPMLSSLVGRVFGSLFFLAYYPFISAYNYKIYQALRLIKPKA